MDWMQITVLTTTEGSELVSQALIELGSAGTMIEDKRDVSENQRPKGQWDYIDEQIAERMSDDVRVTGYYDAESAPESLLEQIRSKLRELRALDAFDFGKLEIESTSVDDEDWAEYWKKDFVPIRLGEHMVVKPEWTDYDARPGDKIIQIDPGMAFGTGSHETTSLCVELVERYVKPGDQVIDVGTGTGILSIAAALMGAKDVLAIDIDPIAVRVARENVEKNGFAQVIDVRQGDLMEAVERVADVVIANIIADVVIALVAPVRAHIARGGFLICSGIPVDRVGEVVSALEDANYTQLDVRERGEWAAICCVKG